MGKCSLTGREGKGVWGNRFSIGAADLNASENCQALFRSSTVTPVTSQPSQNLQTLQNRARIVPVFRRGNAARSQAGNEDGRRGERHASSGNLIASGASLLSSQGHAGVRAGGACRGPSVSNACSLWDAPTPHRSCIAMWHLCSCTGVCISACLILCTSESLPSTIDF